MNENNLSVSSAPHIKSNDTTQKIMLNVIVALIPAIIASVIIFGVRALFLMIITVLSCVLSEYISRKVMKRENTIDDFSAVVTGILLALNLPVSIDYYIAVIGSVVAIVVVKQMFGGIGQNFVNPALIARIVLMTSFPQKMTNWVSPFCKNNFDMITTATPLKLLNSEIKPSYIDLLIGNCAGCIGEVCKVVLIIGCIYLVARKIIKITIPCFFIGIVFVLSLILGQDPLYQILSGGLLLGAIFMATDYATSPLTHKGKIIYAIGCGILTTLIRIFGVLPEGVSFAIIIMNLLVPHIERLTIPKVFGEEGNTYAR